MEGFSICSALILFRFTSVSNFQMAELRQSIHKILCEDTISNEDRLIAVFQMLTSAAIYQVLSLFWNGILKMFDLLIIIFWWYNIKLWQCCSPFSCLPYSQLTLQILTTWNNCTWKALLTLQKLQKMASWTCWWSKSGCPML